ncbi:M1 family metallopeptidase [Streptomyces sp. SAJ15]|uniref:M1 family metallopeptidase n=1 Tax=Streptomyces sp. SAJ15 TaxID=2011095 RepID=UPI0021B2AC1D|nr:M1 family metallopeptidase [Streptomyces sp. SAJ15]
MRPYVPRRSPLRALCGALLVLACTATGCSGDADSKEGAAAARPGAAGAGDPLFPKLGNGGYDVTHYKLTLDYAPDDNRLKGTAEITARATEPLSSFNLDLAGLTVRKATVDGMTATFTRGGTELTVTPKSSLSKGRIFKASIRYDGTPKTIHDPDGSIEGWIETDDGAVGLGQPTGSMAWFPGNHHPSDKAAYDVDVTVPTDYTAVSNGELESREATGERTTYRWHTGEPMASYLATLAVGQFEVTDTVTDGDLPQYNAVDYDEVDASRKVSEQVSEIIDWQSRRFGPYPFSSTGAIVDRNPDVGYALETQTKPYFGAAPDELLLVHELAHQWFGNSVTPRSWQDMWLNEGFATYAEWLWEADHDGRSADEIFQDFWDGTDDQSEGIWAFPPGSPPSAEAVSDSPVYGRGAMTLHKVREAVGDDTFFSIVRTWLKRHRHGNADTRAFIALCEKESGKDLSEIFDVWLYGKGKPDRP